MQQCSSTYDHGKALTNPEFQDIGDLPTGFMFYKRLGIDRIFMRQLHVRELPLIYLSNKSDRGTEYLIRVMNAVSSIDTSILTEADFMFCMAWLRKSSYPEAPTFVRWDCNNPIVEEEDGEVRFATANDKEVKSCGFENNELVQNTQMRITSLDDDYAPLPEYADFPRMNTLQAYEDHVKEFPEDRELASLARYCAYGNTLKEKIAALDCLTKDQFYFLVKLRKEWYGVYEILNLRCKNCGYRTPYRSNLNFKSFFASNTEQNILDIEYSMLTHFNLPPNPDMQTKRFFYFNSSLGKDLKEAEELRRIKAAQAKKV